MTKKEKPLRSTPSTRIRDKYAPYAYLVGTIIVAGGFLAISYYLDATNFGLENIAIGITIIAFGGTIYEIVRSSRGENLTATLQILEKLGSEDFRKARDKLTYGNIKWDDEGKFLDDVSDDDKLKTRQLMAELNQTGLLVSRNLIDSWMVLDLYHSVIKGAWEKMEDFIKKNRVKKNFPYYMVHFEKLYKASKDWAKKENTM